ncbi:hypothetical protein IWW50_006384 [Coemansia erecta]|nr:hypothetical protein GGF43_004364 [Coemansia sp. RSA 2618]KAJ2816770.1 hypothetical protein IWW50_006384 [Coemansia erecta]
MADDAASSGTSSTLLLSSILVLALTMLFGWYILSKQSAAISQKSMALASGATTLSSPNKNTVIIAGPMGTGKTALWCHLRFTATSATRAVPRTQTSMAINAAHTHVDGSRAYLVDVPGHQKFRFDRDTQLAAARAVVFVVDSVEAARDIRPTAETLYDVLANRHVQEKECPVLVLCNKQDDPLALANVRIKALLEEEIDVLRGSRQAGLDSLQGTAHGSAAAYDDDAAAEERASDFLGFDGKKFAFEDLSHPVQFNESSMVVGHDAGGLEQVERWIADALEA